MLFVAVESHRLVRTQAVQPKRCECHGLTYVFRGYSPTNGAALRTSRTLADVARRAGVSTGTVSNVLNRPASVPEATRVKVALAVSEVGYLPGAWSADPAAHWRRNGFATWLFHPAATGSYAKKAPQATRPVPVLAEPWPGLPVRGRNAIARADACWVPIAPGLTHGLRHTRKTLMEELGTPSKLMDERMGHSDGSVQARYTHVTTVMRERLLEGLSELWEAALDVRTKLAPTSRVPVLDRLLAPRAWEAKQ